MTGTEEQVAAGLRRLAVDQDAAPPPLDDLVRRGRHTVRARVLAGTVAAGVVGIAGAVGLTVGMSGAPDGQPAHPSAGAATAPRVDLVAAARTTSASTYRFTTTYDGPDSNGTCVGAMNPTDRTGYESDRAHETRLVGGVQYVRMAGKDWREQPGQFGDSFDCGVPGVGGTVDPAAVLASLRTKGAVHYVGRTGSGADATDVFAYSYQIKRGAPNYLGYRGQISVAVESGYVQHITSAFVTGTTVDGSASVTYSHVGEPVSVSRPAGATGLPPR